MNFHTYGEKGNKAAVLIHGMLTPWQMWNTAAATLQEDHYVIVPELDAHTEESATVLHSVGEEADKIREYIMDELGGQVSLLAGLSMGGRIATTIAKSGDLDIGHLVIDGAPLAPVNGLMRSVMKSNYKKIIRKTKERDARTLEQAKKVFLPEDLIPYYIKIAENMTEESIDNVIDSVFADFAFTRYSSDMKILFMHGTRSNESVSRKSAVRMKEMNPQTEIRQFDGLAHGELACFRPDQWIREVEGFIR